MPRFPDWGMFPSFNFHDRPAVNIYFFAWAWSSTNFINSSGLIRT